MTGDAVILEARKWLHVPFRRKGRTRSGIDCVGFIIVVGWAFDIPFIDRDDYFDQPTSTRELVAECNRYLVRVPIQSGAVPGTIGLFAERTLPGHCGFFSQLHDVPHVIHARLDTGVIEQPYRAQDPTMRLLYLFSYPGFEA